MVASLVLLASATGAHATPPRSVGFRETARVHIGHSPVSLAVGDLNGDGRPDVLVVNDDSTLTLLSGDGAGGLAVQRQYSAGRDLAAVVLGDVDLDGVLDAAVSSPASGTVLTLLAPGVSDFGEVHALQAPWTPGPLAFLNLARGLPDLVVADLFFQSLVVAQTNGGGTYAFASQLPGFVDPVAIAVGDVRPDARPDVAVADAASHLATVVDDVDRGVFTVRHDQPLTGRPFAVGLGDLDRDGHDDLVVATRSPGTLAVCRGAADGSLGPAHAVPADPAPTALVLGDFDGDGRLDVAVADHDFVSIAVWVGRGNGTFDRLGAIPTGAGPVALALGDMNRDGWPDLVCANHDDGTVQVLLNTSTLAAGTIHLFAPAPNPASATSLLTFTLSVSMTVRLDVYDLSGRLVRNLVDGAVMPAGPHTVSWNGRSVHADVVRSGVYLVRLRAGGADVSTRLVLGR